MGENIYLPCAGIPKTKPSEEIDQETIDKLSKAFEVLPSFEKTVFEHKFVKHYSLERNELFKCRWKQYRENFDKKVFTPFHFPEMRDLHFYNGAIRFLPNLTINRQPDQRMKLKPGPMVDWKGQVPIPYEFIMKRGVAKKEAKPGVAKHKKTDKPGVAKEKKNDKPGVTKEKKNDKPGVTKEKKNDKPGIAKEKKNDKPGIAKEKKIDKPEEKMHVKHESKIK